MTLVLLMQKTIGSSMQFTELACLRQKVRYVEYPKEVYFVHISSTFSCWSQIYLNGGIMQYWQ